MMSFPNTKMGSIIKDAEEKRLAQREKAMLVFCFQLLIDKGIQNDKRFYDSVSYLNTAATFSKECSLNLESFCPCDNIDLQSIFLEFETYYHLRYQRYPQYFRKHESGLAMDAVLDKMKSNSNLRARNQRQSSTTAQRYQMSIREPSDGDANTHGSKLDAVRQAMETNLISSYQLLPSTDFEGSDSRLLKPISSLEFGNEDLRNFAEMIQKEMVVKDSLNTKWEDVIGLDEAKLVLKESLLYSNEFRNFFGQGLTPWRGLLLYGPPGVGKTLLARAVATECETTFFNISSSSILSKWRGDSEKILKTVFEMARYHAPSILFFDEFDALATSRDSPGESDPSRRLKSELLQQMDGIVSKSTPNPIFILAATNLPWELDGAILRRFEKRIYIPLPRVAERVEIFKFNLDGTAQSVYSSSEGKNQIHFEIDLNILAKRSENYSGSDLAQIVKEAVVRKFRSLYGHQGKIRQLSLCTMDILNVMESIPPTVKSNSLQKFQAWESNSRPT